MVRCPACKTVFAPADGLGPPEPEEEPREEPTPKKAARKEEDKPAGAHRDFDPIDPDEKPKRRRRRPEDDDTLSPAERKALRAAFTRAAWGCQLIWISFSLFIVSMVLIIFFRSQLLLSRFEAPSQGLIVTAGAIALVYWALAAVGVGLCLSGPASPGHWRFGIAAASAVVLHLILLAVLVAKGKELSGKGTAFDWGTGAGAGADVRWG